MDRRKITKDLEGRFVLPRSLEIADIGKVYREVLKVAESTYKKFVLDAGEVALVDTVGIQLVIQLLMGLRPTGCEDCWINDSVQIYQMAAELGIADQLEA